MERRERRHHTREFKLEAVRLAGLGDKTKAKVARELGIRVNQLRQWRLDLKKSNATAFRGRNWPLPSRMSASCGARSPVSVRRTTS
jgi:transposase-like protein